MKFIFSDLPTVIGSPREGMSGRTNVAFLGGWSASVVELNVGPVGSRVRNELEGLVSKITILCKNVACEAYLRTVVEPLVIDGDGIDLGFGAEDPFFVLKLLRKTIKAGTPAGMILLGGHLTDLDQVRKAIQLGVPMILVKGSGGIADIIACQFEGNDGPLEISAIGLAKNRQLVRIADLEIRGSLRKAANELHLLPPSH